MKITINTPLTFTEIGRKANQEDMICPSMNNLNSDTRCFVLCDGMGGHENGEVAAEIVATNLQPRLVASATDPDIITIKRFNTALIQTYAKLNEMPVTSGKTPGTTMTCVYLGENAVLAAHIGDSRIYQVRPGKGIVFKSRDHSLVNDLLRAGEITEEEAITFPRKNIITRAMQPNLEHPYRADITLLTDVKAGDFFFMCSDGIIENVSDETLVQILGDINTSDDDKLNAIYDLCYGNTRDNYTCIMIHVSDVTGGPLPTPEESAITPLNIDAENGDAKKKREDSTDNEETTNFVDRPTENVGKINRFNKITATMKPRSSKKPNSLFTTRNIVIALCILAVIVFLIFIFAGDGSDKKNNENNGDFNDVERLDFGDMEDTVTFSIEDGNPSNLTDNETGTADEYLQLEENSSSSSGKGKGSSESSEADEGGTDEGHLESSSSKAAESTEASQTKPATSESAASSASTEG